MAKPTYKFQNVKAGKDPISGRQLYQQVMMVDYDGKTSSYKTSRHNSRQGVNDDLTRMIATIDASLQETPGARTVKQGYGGESKFRTIGSSAIAEAVKGGGQLKAPDTYELSRNVGGMQNIQGYDQRGIRKGPSITREFSNMLDPNYDLATDTVKAPTDGSANETGMVSPTAKPSSVIAQVAQGVGQAGLLSGAKEKPRSLLSRSSLRNR